MSGSGRGRKPKSGLTAEEHLLWEHAAQSMTPLTKLKGRVLDGADEALFEAAFGAPLPKRRAATGVKSAGLPGLPATPVALAKSAKAAAPELAAFDRKNARRLRDGRIEIEGRVDLHGMRQDEAHGALVRFLVSAQGQGKKWVLVITGKGAPRRTGWFGDDGEPAGGSDPVSSSRGIIRRNVPRWLQEPQLRAVVVSHTTAAPQHGGEGAMYVELRKRG